MASFNPVFEIDAAKILAKLHIAGQSQVPNSKVINTGIKDNDPNATPDNPGKVTFAFSKSGEYQLAIVKKIQYRVPIDLQKNKNIMKADQDLQKLKQPSIFDTKGQEAKEDGDKADGKEAEKKEETKGDEKKDEKKQDDTAAKKEELNNKTSLTDKDAQKKTDVKKESIQVMSFLDFLTEDGEDKKDDKKDDKDKKEEEKDKKEIDKIHATLMNEFDSLAEFEVGKQDADAEEAKGGMKNMFDEGGFEKGKHDPEKFTEDLALFMKCLEEENKHRLEYKKQMIDETKSSTLEDMKTYFINFAGKDNQAKIDQNKIVSVVLDLDGKTADDPTTFKNIKDGKIETGKILQDMQKEEEKIQATKPNELCTRSIGCAVGYAVDPEL